MDSDIEEVPQPPTPAIPSLCLTSVESPAVEAVQRLYQSQQNWCAELLQSTMNEHAAKREQLASALRRRQDALLRVRIAQCMHSAVELMKKNCHRRLREVLDNCRRMLAELENESRWRPASITMAQIHQRELIERVARLQTTLAAMRRSRRALPSDGPLGNTRRA